MPVIRSTRSRQGKTTTNKDVSDCAPSRLSTLARDVGNILDRPTVALSIFVLGIFFIVVASKQVKAMLDLLETFKIVVNPREGIMGNFMVVFVFLFVWLDVLLFHWFKGRLYVVASWLLRQYHRFLVMLEKMEKSDKHTVAERKRNKRRH